jgi:hypothetical protein
MTNDGAWKSRGLVIALMMEAASTYETLVNVYQGTTTHKRDIFKN